LIVVLLAGAVYLGYANRDLIFATAIKTMREGSNAQLALLEKEGRVPEAHRALYDELKSHLTDPKLGLFGILAVQEPVHDALFDNTLDESEVKMLELALDFLKKHPAPSFYQYYRFGRSYDALLQGIVEDSSARELEKVRASQEGHRGTVPRKDATPEPVESADAVEPAAS
jgi:hypothetical protein